MMSVTLAWPHAAQVSSVPSLSRVHTPHTQAAPSALTDSSVRCPANAHSNFSVGEALAPGGGGVSGTNVDAENERSTKFDITASARICRDVNADCRNGSRLATAEPRAVEVRATSMGLGGGGGGKAARRGGGGGCFSQAKSYCGHNATTTASHIHIHTHTSKKEYIILHPPCMHAHNRTRAGAAVNTESTILSHIPQPGTANRDRQWLPTRASSFQFAVEQTSPITWTP